MSTVSTLKRYLKRYFERYFERYFVGKFLKVSVVPVAPLHYRESSLMHEHAGGGGSLWKHVAGFLGVLGTKPI